MSPRHRLLAALAIAILATAVFFWQRHDARAARADAEHLRRSRADFKKPLIVLRNPPPAAVQPKPVPSTQPWDLSKAKRLSSKRGPAEALRQNPALQARYIAVRKATYPVVYGPLFQKLRLTNDQTHRLETAMAERDGAVLDLASASDHAVLNLQEWQLQSYNPQPIQLTLAPGSVPDPLADQIAQTFRDAVTTAIGPDGYNQVAQYEAAAPLRNLVNTVNGALSFSQLPMTPDQSAQLMQILTHAAPTDKPAATGTMPWSQILPQAQAILSPGQYAALATFSQQAPPLNVVPQLFDFIPDASNPPPHQ